ncbi:hypothetical protein P0D88_25890 [Paraburkholderia sp. RL18-103-BIB-C]|uniref:hypothetical protein n=1 Tax=unclassified Paraburkholderia TaxID=2615204 RepID=UPI0038B85FF6
MDYAGDAVLYSEFKSMDACAYAPHPVHLQTRRKLQRVSIARHSYGRILTRHV